MARRVLPAVPPEPVVPEYEPDPHFLPSGSVNLDCVLGGGWRRGRIVNIVGDSSSGKTLLAIEACANFVRMGGSVKNIRYAEAEAAFDVDYAATLGLPEDLELSDNLETVEQFFDDLNEWLDKQEDGGSCLYVLDSLDALSDDAEMKKDMDKGTYGAEKAKKMSQLFRRIVRKVETKGCVLAVISQIRDKLNVTFGEKKTRSGGRALQFYCTQVLWLAEIKKIKRTVSGVDRITGIEVLAKTKKNKAAPPFRDCVFTLLFNYGMDDELSMLDWLKDHKAFDLVPRSEKEYRDTIGRARIAGDRELLSQIHAELREATQARWDEIEEAIRPPMSKYG